MVRLQTFRVLQISIASIGANQSTAPINNCHHLEHWSTACKASDGSVSPILPTVAPSNDIQTTTLLVVDRCIAAYPTREASSFDSGKGTLSNKASSSSESSSSNSDNDDVVVADAAANKCNGGVIDKSTSINNKHVSTAINDMPALKRALESKISSSWSPPLPPPPSTQPPHSSSIRDRHKAVASLLERPSMRCPMPSSSWQPMAAHHASTLLPLRRHHQHEYDDDQPLNLCIKRAH